MIVTFFSLWRLCAATLIFGSYSRFANGCTETLVFDSDVFGGSSPNPISFEFDLSSADDPVSVHLSVENVWGDFTSQEDAQVFVDDTLVTTCSPVNACSGTAAAGGSCISTPLDVTAHSRHLGNHLRVNLTYVSTGGGTYFCDEFKARATLVVVNTLATCPPTSTPTPGPSLAPVLAPSPLPTPLPTSTRPSFPPTPTPTPAPTAFQIEFTTRQVEDSCASDGCTMDYEFVLGKDALSEAEASSDWTRAFLTVDSVRGDVNAESEYLTVRVNDLVAGTCLNRDLGCDQPGKGFLSDGEVCCNPQPCLERLDVTDKIAPGSTTAEVTVTGSSQVDDGDCGSHEFKLAARYFLTLVAPYTHPPSPSPTSPSQLPTQTPTPLPSALVVVATPGTPSPSAAPTSSEPLLSCPPTSPSSTSSSSSSSASSFEEVTWTTSAASQCPFAQLFLFQGTQTYKATLSAVLPNSQGQSAFEWDVASTLIESSGAVLCGASGLVLKLRCTLDSLGGGASDHFSGPFTIGGGTESGGGDSGGDSGDSGDSNGSGGGSDDSTGGASAASSSIVLFAGVALAVTLVMAFMGVVYSRRQKNASQNSAAAPAQRRSSSGRCCARLGVWPHRNTTSPSSVEMATFVDILDLHQQGPGTAAVSGRRSSLDGGPMATTKFKGDEEAGMGGLVSYDDDDDDDDDGGGGGGGGGDEKAREKAGSFFLQGMYQQQQQQQEEKQEDSKKARKSKTEKKKKYRSAAGHEGHDTEVDEKLRARDTTFLRSISFFDDDSGGGGGAEQSHGDSSSSDSDSNDIDSNCGSGSDVGSDDSDAGSDEFLAEDEVAGFSGVGNSSLSPNSKRKVFPYPNTPSSTKSRSGNPLRRKAEHKEEEEEEEEEVPWPTVSEVLSAAGLLEAFGALFEARGLLTLRQLGPEQLSDAELVAPPPPPASASAPSSAAALGRPQGCPQQGYGLGLARNDVKALRVAAAKAAQQTLALRKQHRLSRLSRRVGKSKAKAARRDKESRRRRVRKQKEEDEKEGEEEEEEETESRDREDLEAKQRGVSALHSLQNSSAEGQPEDRAEETNLHRNRQKHDDKPDLDKPPSTFDSGGDGGGGAAGGSSTSLSSRETVATGAMVVVSVEAAPVVVSVDAAPVVLTQATTSLPFSETTLADSNDPLPPPPPATPTTTSLAAGIGDDEAPPPVPEGGSTNSTVDRDLTMVI